MLAVVAGVTFVLVMGMTSWKGMKAATVEDAIRGTEAPPLPPKVAYGRTPAALVPSSFFIVAILVATLWAFGHLWGLPVQFQVR